MSGILSGIKNAVGLGGPDASTTTTSATAAPLSGSALASGQHISHEAAPIVKERVHDEYTNIDKTR
jgi:hypothetical protein